MSTLTDCINPYRLEFGAQSQAKKTYSSEAEILLAQFRDPQPATAGGDDIESRLRAVAVVVLADLVKPEVYAIAREEAKFAFGSSSRLAEDDDSKGSAGE